MQPAYQLKIRLPTDLRAFVAEQAEKYGSTLNAEIVRAVRERMDRTTAAGLDRTETPTKSSNHELLERR